MTRLFQRNALIIQGSVVSKSSTVVDLQRGIRFDSVKNYKKNYKWGREKIISDRRIIRKAKSNGNAYPGVTRAWINWRVEGWYGIIRKLLGIE